MQPPSIASFTMFSGSKNAGFGANDAAPECSMPWSTGRIDRNPVCPSRPLPNINARLRSTDGERSVIATTRSMKSGPGRWSMSFEMPRQV